MQAGLLSAHTIPRLKSLQDLRGFLLLCKADDNAAERQKDRKDGVILIAE
jgi:hypothetical protein